MRIAVIGTGYVGLVSGACLADLGHHVVCVDKDAAKIAELQEGNVPIHETGLDALIGGNVRRRRLRFSLDTQRAVRDADVVFIAVGTPPRSRDGFADLTYVYEAAREIAADLSGFTVVVTKSTVPVGTGDEVERIIRARRPNAKCAVISNPEFLREGSAVRDFLEPDRIVIGTDNERARGVMRSLYAPLQAAPGTMVFTERRAAELIKYAANAFLATKITFINEVADLCEQVGADVTEVARGMGLDPRIGAQYLRAGPGFGGSCFPKDTLAFLKTAQDHGVALRIVEAVVGANETRKRAMARKVSAAVQGGVRGRVIGVLGLTFKPNTDDMREAPALSLIAALQDLGALIRVHDPVGERQAQAMLGDVTFCPTSLSCAQDADCLVIVTDWDEFRALDLSKLQQVMLTPTVVDLRNMFPPDEMQRLGFNYVSIGRSRRVATAATVRVSELPATRPIGAVVAPLVSAGKRAARAASRHSPRGQPPA